MSSEVRYSRGVIASLLVAMLLPFFSSIIYFVILKDSAIAQSVYSLTKAFTLVWPLVVYYFLLNKKLPAVRIFPNKPRDIIEGTISGLVVIALMVLLWELGLNQVLDESAFRIRTKVNDLGVANYYWTFALLISLLHSLLEEYYWRWFVFGGLCLVTKRRTAHILAGVAFTAHHIVVLSQYFTLLWVIIFGLAVFIGGITWSLMYERHNTLCGAWISHILVDLGIFYFGYLVIF